MGDPQSGQLVDERPGGGHADHLHALLGEGLELGAEQEGQADVGRGDVDQAPAGQRRSPADRRHVAGRSPPPRGSPAVDVEHGAARRGALAEPATQVGVGRPRARRRRPGPRVARWDDQAVDPVGRSPGARRRPRWPRSAVPALVASIRMTGSPSWREGSTKTSQPTRSRRTSSRSPRNRNRRRGRAGGGGRQLVGQRAPPDGGEADGQAPVGDRAGGVEEDVVALLRAEVGHGDAPGARRRRRRARPAPRPGSRAASGDQVAGRDRSTPWTMTRARPRRASRAGRRGRHRTPRSVTSSRPMVDRLSALTSTAILFPGCARCRRRPVAVARGGWPPPGAPATRCRGGGSGPRRTGRRPQGRGAGPSTAGPSCRRRPASGPGCRRPRPSGTSPSSDAST